ncbi:MAG: sel1 repeat family protein [Oligoflexia bacterium]|nr:sel1 repeat family protein [Oligoflexia bacterium]
MFSHLVGVYSNGPETFHFIINDDQLVLLTDKNEHRKLIHKSEQQFKLEGSETIIEFLLDGHGQSHSIKMTISGRTIVANRKTIDKLLPSEEKISIKMRDLIIVASVAIVILIAFQLTYPKMKNACLQNNNLTACNLTKYQGMLVKVSRSDRKQLNAKIEELDFLDKASKLKDQCLTEKRSSSCHNYAKGLYDLGKQNDAIEIFKQNCRDKFYDSCNRLKYIYTQTNDDVELRDLSQTLCGNGDGASCYEIAQYALRKRDNERYFEYLKISCSLNYSEACLTLSSNDNNLPIDEKIKYLKVACNKTGNTSACESVNVYNNLEVNKINCKKKNGVSCSSVGEFYDKYYSQSQARTYYEQACQYGHSPSCKLIRIRDWRSGRN